jgi:uncharacterized protein
MVEIPVAVTDSVRHFIRILRKDKRIISVYMYGSFVYGTADKWSDVDLAIISPDFSEDLFEERVNLMKIAVKIDDRIEPHPFRPDDFNLKHPLVKETSERGIKLRE